jgi:hypothetical protein
MVECCYAQCHLCLPVAMYVEYHKLALLLSEVIFSEVMLSEVMLTVIMLIVVMLSVVAPFMSQCFVFTTKATT